MKNIGITTSCALAALAFANGVAADTAGTLLFAQPGTQIVATSGVARAASKGDTLQTGERLLTPAGAISQVVLPDGSLIGMRPDSELKIDAAPAGSDNKAPVVGLVSGTARVIGADLMDSKKTSNITLQSGSATVKLKGADLESAVVKADGKSVAADGAPGSYQRLLVGTGSVANGNQVAALAPRQVSYVGGGSMAPITLAAPPQNLFADNRGNPAAPATGSTARNPGAATPINTPKLGNLTPPAARAPVVPVPPVTPPAPKPCTRFIGKTCIQ